MAGKKQGQGESKASERRVLATGRQAQALKLRAAGTGYEEIARAVGYANASGAFKAVVCGLKKTLAEPANELRTLELKRLDNYLLAISKQVQSGDLKAIDRAIKISERRSRLLGLDAPTKIAPTDPTGEEQYDNNIPSEGTADRIMAVLNAVRERRDRQLALDREQPDGA